ncbi:MAG TPA: hypothetical protein VGM12_19380 [Trebonia sp.]
MTAASNPAADPAEPRRPAEPAGANPAGGGLAGPARPPPPAAFTAEIRAAARYESGLAVKAVAVLAALAVILVLRALYLLLSLRAVSWQRRANKESSREGGRWHEAGGGYASGRSSRPRRRWRSRRSRSVSH